MRVRASCPDGYRAHLLLDAARPIDGQMRVKEISQPDCRSLVSGNPYRKNRPHAQEQTADDEHNLDKNDAAFDLKQQSRPT